MVEMEYLLETDALRDTCNRQDALSNNSLVDLEMLMRLRVGDTEVFGHTDEEYQRWLEDLKRYNVTLHVPSAAWGRLSVLAIAVEVEDAFLELRQAGHASIYSLDCVMRLARQDDIVSVHIRCDRVGQAPYNEMYAAFTSFANHVRRDFLSICPQLGDHMTLGSWFRGEARSELSEKPQEVIHLPSQLPRQ